MVDSESTYVFLYIATFLKTLLEFYSKPLRKIRITLQKEKAKVCNS